MTARLLPVSVPKPPVSFYLADRPTKSINRKLESTAKSSSSKTLGQPTAVRNYQDRPSRDSFWNALVESIPQGVLVVTKTLSLTYANSKGKELCKQLPYCEDSSTLPSVIVEACYQLIQEGESSSEPLVIEIRGKNGEPLRLKLRWFPLGQNDPSYLLIQLENYYEVLREELWIEQRKYDFTEREAEIWILLRQEHMYQEISDILKISLNTVKTHVKSIYAKRSRIHQNMFWASR
jgi:PAS domain-containing protein